MSIMKNDWSDISISNLKNIRGSDAAVSFYLTANKSTIAHFSPVLMRSENNNDHVILGFSKKNNAIAIFFTSDDKHPGAVKVSKRNSTGSIAIQSFLNACCIDKVKLKGKYRAEQQKIDGKNAWIIFLDKKVEELSKLETSEASSS